MLFEYDETDNPKQIMECKTAIIQMDLIAERKPNKRSNY
jgi:hypothetical protein